MYRIFMQQKLGILYPWVEFFANQLLDRMILVQGYLHSALSPTIQARLAQEQGSSTHQLMLDAIPNPRAELTIKKILAKFWRERNLFKAIPLNPMLRIAKAGRSFHIGGSFPMRANPQQFETDILGRPAGWENLHVVDASVFTSIPATTITFTVMANAHRNRSQ